MSTVIQQEVNVEKLFAPNGHATKTIRYYARKLIDLKVYAEAELDDIEQDLSLRLLEGIRRFEAQRSSLTTFVDRILGFAAMEMFRKRCSPSRVKQRRMVSLDGTRVQRNGETKPLTQLLSAEDQFREHGLPRRCESETADLRIDLAAAIRALPRSLREACQKVLSDANPSFAIKKLPQEIRDQLRQHFQSNGFSQYV